VPRRIYGRQILSKSRPNEENNAQKTQIRMDIPSFQTSAYTRFELERKKGQACDPSLDFLEPHISSSWLFLPPISDGWVRTLAIEDNGPE
jgi:hypothetical protein